MVQNPFSLQDLREIKTDLGKFSNYLNKYIEVVQSLTQMFGLSYRDLLVLLE